MINIVLQLRLVNDFDFEDKQFKFDFEKINFRNIKNSFICQNLQ
jgi:hypothetical protein